MKIATVATAAPGSPATRYPMNAAVMTTGPGVISPIATASRNCRSTSQWCWFTTPSRRNGTMASPLPKMNAPAFRKNRPRLTSVPVVTAAVATASGLSAAAPGEPWPRRPGRSHGGGASSAIISRPAPTNSTATSAPVTAVTTPVITEIAHSFGSAPSVSRASFTAATPITGITAGAIP